MLTTVVDGITLSYIDEGSGDPVILLHGWGGQAASMMPLMLGLRDSYRVVALDLPGFGKSSLPPAAWGTLEYAEFTLHAIRALGVERGTFVGHSFGGRLVIQLASHRPQAVQAAVLIDAAGINPPMTLRRRIRQGAFKTLKRILSTGLLGRQEPILRERLARRFGSADYAAVSGVMRSSMVKIVNQDLSQDLPTIAAPVLLIWGEKDEETPIADGRTMERLIPGSRLIAVAGAGHFCYLDSPGFVNAVIRSFLGGTRESDRP